MHDMSETRRPVLWKWAVFAIVGQLQLSGALGSIDPITDAEDRQNPAAPVLVCGARSKVAVVRARAAMAFGRIQKPECVDPLLFLLRDREPAVRAAAAFSLGQMAWRAEFAGGREPEIARALACGLGEKDPAALLATVEAVGKIALEQAPDMLLPLLSDRSSRVRAEALMGLFRYRHAMRQREPDSVPPDLPQPVFDKLSTLAGDRAPCVRRALIYGFARFKDPRGLPLAVRLSADVDEWTRFFSLIALAKIAAPSSAAPVEARLGDGSANVRLAAVQACAAIRVTEPLHGVVGDPDVHVRSAVAEALGAKATAPGDPAVGWLRQLAADESGEVRGAAVKALAKCLGAGADDDVRKAAGDSEDHVRASAVEAAARLSPEDRESVVAAALADTSAVVRASLLALLASDTSEEAFQVIRGDLSSPDVDVRLAAISALKGRLEPQVADLGWKTYEENMDYRFSFLREEMVNVMAALDDGTGNSYLREMVGDEFYPAALAAYKILVQRGAADIAPPVEKLTFSPFRDLHPRRFPVVEFQTTRGTMRVVFFRDEAPIHVANAIGLVRQGFFDGKTWQRVVPNFVIQGGSPSPSGAESQRFMLRAEINGSRFERGAVGMSRSDLFGTGDSQLFITHVPAPHLNGVYTMFGRVVGGLDTLDKMEAGDVILKAIVVGD